jgi:hypothetical protein
MSSLIAATGAQGCSSEWEHICDHSSTNRVANLPFHTVDSWGGGTFTEYRIFDDKLFVRFDKQAGFTAGTQTALDPSGDAQSGSMRGIIRIGKKESLPHSSQQRLRTMMQPI